MLKNGEISFFSSSLRIQVANESSVPSRYSYFYYGFTLTHLRALASVRRNLITHENSSIDAEPFETSYANGNLRNRTIYL